MLAGPVTHLLSKAIKVIDLNKVRDNKAGKILNSPWTSIPDVKTFMIQLNLQDPLFTLFGIKKSFAPTLYIQGYKNKDMNRYLKHQILRLSKARSNPTLYWGIAKILMKRSNVFRVAAINHVFKNWHRNYPLGFIINVNRLVSKLINKGIDTLDYKRVYIPKDSNRWRPLGIPKPEWRMYLHMYSNFLTFFLQPHLKHQHGFLVNKGTLSAWKEIFMNGLEKKANIYEWDFKNFFNEIWNNRISDELIRLQIPREIVYFLENINRSNVQLPAKEKVDEQIFKDQKEGQEGFKSGMLNEDHPSLLWIKEFRRENPELLAQFMQEDGCSTIQEYLQLQWALIDSANMSIGKSHKIETDFNGVAQGSPTSPILANVIQNLWIKENLAQGHSIVAYADDSVTFSDKEVILTAPEDTGIKFNEEKSGYVKRNGVWLKPLKFLGLSFDGNILKANTRKGSELEVKNWVRILTKLDSSISTLKEGLTSVEDILKWIEERQATLTDEHGYFSKSSWENVFKSRLIGFIQSRLYQGHWNLENLHQDFQMSFVNGSWMDTKLRKEKLDVFNSTSYASYSLLNIFRWNQKLRRARKPTLVIRLGKPGGK